MKKGRVGAGSRVGSGETRRQVNQLFIAFVTRPSHCFSRSSTQCEPSPCRSSGSSHRLKRDTRRQRFHKNLYGNKRFNSWFAVLDSQHNLRSMLRIAFETTHLEQERNLYL